MARIHIVKKCRKDQGKCSKCGKAIVKGDSYKWVQTYRSRPRIRCSDCPSWKPSELTGSDKLAAIYSAQEMVGEINTDGDVREIISTLAEAKESLEEAKDGYQESYDNMESAFPGGCPTMEELQEKIDALEGPIDEIDSGISELESMADELEALEDELDGLETEVLEAEARQDVISEEALNETRQAVDTQNDEIDEKKAEIQAKIEEIIGLFDDVGV